MGFEMVTWNPRVGTTGDGIYNIPGTYGLDGTLDPSYNARWNSGLVSGYTINDIPTIDQINASTDVNQILALYNRRAQLYNQHFGSSLLIYPYVTPGENLDLLPSVSPYRGIAGLASDINYLRSAEGLTQYTFTQQTSRSPTGAALAELRKSLRISGVLMPNATFGAFVYSQGLATPYIRYDLKPYPPGTFSSDGAGPFSNGQLLVGLADPGYSVVERHRLLDSFNMPDWANDPAQMVSATFSQYLYYGGFTAAGYNFNLYSSNTDEYPVTYGLSGSASKTDNLLGTFPQGGGTGVKTINITALNILAARAGGHLSFIEAIDKELAGTSIVNVVAYLGDTNPFPPFPFQYPTFTIDFGA